VAPCEHFEICGLEATDGEFCILHSPNPEKDNKLFKSTLISHMSQQRNNFAHMIFPSGTDFQQTTFEGNTTFAGAQFLGAINFDRVQFTESVSFVRARFYGDTLFSFVHFSDFADFALAIFKDRVRFIGIRFRRANLQGCIFLERVSFSGKFTKRANFSMTHFLASSEFEFIQFSEDSDFRACHFSGDANFSSIEFCGPVSFREAQFRKELLFENNAVKAGADFYSVSFFKKALFSGNLKNGKLIQVFSESQDSEIDFRKVTGALDSISFQDADLTKFRFMGTDLRKPVFINVKWREWQGRSAIYDEKAYLKKSRDYPYGHIEPLYRELKQNYEDRKDFERASDFHYGEKEMRRKNPDTPLRLKIPLYAYWLVSGYGERYLRSLLSICVVVLLSMIGYLAFGLETADATILDWTSRWDRLQAAHYALRVMTLLKPDDLVPIGYSQFIHTADSILGPVLIGLFALAVRQRLKR
jgi:uncharacterized protein YjbI with pentapeptide repeats